VPGFFIGGDSPAPLSSLPVRELVARLHALEIEGADFSFYEWEGVDHLRFWPGRARGTLFGDLPAAKVRELAALFDRRSDPALIGTLIVHRVELSE